jgi:predicted porin
MKKTLIAMAAVAVAGAATAQVTISGSAAAGYKMVTNNSAASLGGMAVDGFSVTFSASEDLGGGLTAAASATIDGITHGSGVNANASTMSLAGGFGKISMSGSAESCDGLSGYAQGVRLDGAGFGCADSESDALAYQFPAVVPGLDVKVTFGDSLKGYSVANGDSSRLKATTWQANYTAGALMVGGNVTKYEKAAAGDKSNKTRLYATYDLGVAKLGVGTQSGYVAPGAKDDRVVYGVSFPMGALTVAAGAGSIDTGSTKTSSGVNLTYALSKRTSVVGDFTRTSGSAAGGEKAFSRVLVKHSF